MTPNDIEAVGRYFVTKCQGYGRASRLHGRRCRRCQAAPGRRHRCGGIDNASGDYLPHAAKRGSPCWRRLRSPCRDPNGFFHREAVERPGQTLGGNLTRPPAVFGGENQGDKKRPLFVGQVGFIGVTPDGLSFCSHFLSYSFSICYE